MLQSHHHGLTAAVPQVAAAIDHESADAGIQERVGDEVGQVAFPAAPMPITTARSAVIVVPSRRMS
jgi:hypothetical protein